VGELLGEMLVLSDLLRIEFHGPATELEKMKEPLEHLNAACFACDSVEQAQINRPSSCGIRWLYAAQRVRGELRRHALI
jgi:hypothetical protein